MFPRDIKLRLLQCAKKTHNTIGEKVKFRRGHRLRQGGGLHGVSVCVCSPTWHHSIGRDGTHRDGSQHGLQREVGGRQIRGESVISPRGRVVAAVFIKLLAGKLTLNVCNSGMLLR